MLPPFSCANRVPEGKRARKSRTGVSEGIFLRMDIFTKLFRDGSAPAAPGLARKQCAVFRIA
jgi:hypothetical protein